MARKRRLGRGQGAGVVSSRAVEAARCLQGELALDPFKMDYAVLLLTTTERVELSAILDRIIHTY